MRSRSCGPPALDRAHGNLCYKTHHLKNCNPEPCDYSYYKNSSVRLLRHLTAHEITSQIYAWPLMHTLFSEVISKEDFLILFDHVFFHSPGFYYYCVAAYVLCAREPLLAMSRKEDFQFFFHHRNSIPAAQIIQKVKVLLRSTPKSMSCTYILIDYCFVEFKLTCSKGLSY